MYPGFQDPEKHPQNLCVPCCYVEPSTGKDEGGDNLKDMYKGRPKPKFKEDKDGKIIEILKPSTIRKRTKTKEALKKIRKNCNQLEEKEEKEGKERKVYEESKMRREMIRK